jgi:hypothetical protein
VVEVLIAVALLSLMATASFVLIATSFSESLFSQQDARAQNLLVEGLEAVRQIRDRDFASLSAGTYGLLKTGTDWTFSGTQDVTESTYTRRITIAEIDSNARDVTVEIEWAPRPERPLTLETTTRFTNWRTALPAGSNCKLGPVSGNWAAPVVIGTADLGPGNSGTDVVAKLPYLFMSGVAASSAKPDVFVFDVSNPGSPQLIDSINIGAGGVNALYVQGNYLYAASANDAKEFIIFDISTPSDIQQVGSVDLSDSKDGLAVLAYDNLVAVGRQEGTPSELVIFDVTNPSTPSILTSRNVSGDVTDFSVSETLLFASTDEDTEGVIVYDVSNPINPVFVAANDVGHENYYSIAYSDGYLILGDEDDSVVIADPADPENITIRSSFTTNGRVRDVVCVIGDLAFIGTENSNKEFQILDISDLDAITEYSFLNFPQVATGADFANNMVFIAVRSNDALRIITSSP